MTDSQTKENELLVARLRRNWIAWGSPTDRDECINETCMAMDCRDAADEIERLKRELAKVTAERETLYLSLEVADRSISEAHSRWIPVSERLPTKPTDCLVWIYTADPDDGLACCATFDAAYHESFSYGPWVLDIFKPCGTFTVTHWMPLPEAPR